MLGQRIVHDQPLHTFCPMHMCGWLVDGWIIQGCREEVYFTGPACAHEMHGRAALAAKPAGNTRRRLVETAGAVPGDLPATNAKIACHGGARGPSAAFAMAMPGGDSHLDLDDTAEALPLMCISHYSPLLLQ